ncbi:hypothetical protein Dda_7111 [Drechslerella dactyloides]|uniref:Uncharacterized protein n=1 Tax=Drechslerella dactyloides TaxID=74499 RepID=A0AAD6IXH1_DREDA|nr:hypothetical protein Dda_7111 [Drechslerella dactyloides]
MVGPKKSKQTPIAENPTSTGAFKVETRPHRSIFKSGWHSLHRFRFKPGNHRLCCTKKLNPEIGLNRNPVI